MRTFGRWSRHIGAVVAGGAVGVLLAVAPASAGTDTTEPLPDDTAPGSTIAVPDIAPPADGGLPAANGPLVPVPAGCAAPAPAVFVFVGRISAVSATAARFEVDRVLAGSAEDWQVAAGLVDVVYGDDQRFLDVGADYVVGAAADPAIGGLRSAVRAPEPMFGGDAVIGMNDSDVECPVLEDPVRTLRLDGVAVDSGVLTPLDGQGPRLARAVLLPLGVAFVILVALVLLKQTVFAVGRSLRDLGGEPTVRPARQRRHSGAKQAAP